MDAPGTILRGMLDQRARLGLAPKSSPSLPDQPVVVPVVGHSGWNAVYLEKMRKVQRALMDKSCGDPSLEIYEASMAGRMNRLAL